jgi:hypothetical protein
MTHEYPRDSRQMRIFGRAGARRTSAVGQMTFFVALTLLDRVTGVSSFCHRLSRGEAPCRHLHMVFTGSANGGHKDRGLFKHS